MKIWFQRLIMMCVIVILYRIITAWMGLDPVLTAMIFIISEMWWLKDDE